MSSYVCAFRGRRDDYQVPLALAENGKLDQFITDAYAVAALQRMAPLFPARWNDKISLRSKPGIPREKVHCLWGTTAYEHLRHRLGFPVRATFARLDQNFSRASAKRARKTRGDLLLYTPYAWEAFTSTYLHQPRKVLFQYHPHADFEEQLLKEDAARFPEIQLSFRDEIREQLAPELRRRDRDCWRHADLILCASSFTRQTMLEAGADSRLCKVIPYGIDSRAPLGVPQPQGPFTALFVGSGVQRKGLHHLLRAWERATLPRESELILVCRYLDPGLEPILQQARSIRLIRGCSAAHLAELYRTTSLFVMPSLAEGFGQVFLEALSHGCPVLGTTHTGLPDLGDEQDGIFLVKAGNIEHLAARLEQLATVLPNDGALRSRAQATVGRFVWSRFRSEINRHL